jgi:membrane fusion protein (multidrug efflux system)
MEEQASNQTEPAAKPARWPWPAAVALGIGAYIGLAALQVAFTRESTDDAAIEADVVSVAPKVAGHIAGVYVRDNQMVKQGDVLLEIDPRDYQMKLDQRQAASATSEANLKVALSGLELMAAKLTTAQAADKQAHAQEEASGAAATNADLTLDRDRQLVKTGTISQQEFDNAESAARQADANLNSAAENTAESDSKVQEARASWSAAAAAVDWIRAQVAQSGVDVDSANLDLSYTKVFAPCAGRVTRKAVEPGDYVQVGQDLLALVQPDPWVVANFKETQLTQMRTNQPVDIEIDSLPDGHFHGHVDSAMAGSGSRFSLMPPENAVGNFVKVVQRVPVKILFDGPVEAGLVVGPGMSAVPSVQVRADFAPRWLLVVIAIIVMVTAGLGFKALAARRKF